MFVISHLFWSSVAASPGTPRRSPSAAGSSGDWTDWAAADAPRTRILPWWSYGPQIGLQQKSSWNFEPWKTNTNFETRNQCSCKFDGFKRWFSRVNYCNQRSRLTTSVVDACLCHQSCWYLSWCNLIGDDTNWCMTSTFNLATFFVSNALQPFSRWNWPRPGLQPLCAGLWPERQAQNDDWNIIYWNHIVFDKGSYLDHIMTWDFFDTYCNYMFWVSLDHHLKLWAWEGNMTAKRPSNTEKKDPWTIQKKVTPPKTEYENLEERPQKADVFLLETWWVTDFSRKLGDILPATSLLWLRGLSTFWSLSKPQTINCGPIGEGRGMTVNDGEVLYNTL